MNLKPASILCIEDDHKTQELLKLLLEDEVEHFWQAYDGEEALEFIEHHSVDLLLLDIELPRLRGNELLKRVQKRRKNLSVIVISGHATHERRSYRSDQLQSMHLYAKTDRF